MTDKKKVMIFTDGAAKGNPGPGGYGAIVQFTDSKGVLHERTFSAGYRNTTNNRMELMAAIIGLEALCKCPCQVTLTSDSKYLVDAFNQGWIENWQKNGWRTSGKKDVKNIELWKRLLKAVEPHDVTFIWVKGHEGHPENERCDAMASGAACGENLLDDQTE